ncbi:MAG: DNA-directed RNA polymerase [Candidatus Omnitrophica bacterium]|nr:DNA-directed RNA polymerase [Candidatus Omnitrophota bacterium]
MGFHQGGGRGGYDSSRPREFHKAVCAECKKECEVPFKPSNDRPVYCKDCFSKRKDGGR